MTIEELKAIIDKSMNDPNGVCSYHDVMLQVVPGVDLQPGEVVDGVANRAYYDNRKRMFIIEA